MKMETNFKIKFIKIVSIEQSFSDKYSDLENSHKSYFLKKFGSIKDSKGARPYLLFEVSTKNKIEKWVIPGTSSVKGRFIKENQIKNPHWYLKYIKFHKKIPQDAVFEFYNMHPIIDKYIKEYKISWYDNGSYINSDNASFLLKQVINTNVNGWTTYKINIGGKLYSEWVNKLEGQITKVYNEVITRKIKFIKLNKISDALKKEQDKKESDK